MRYTLLLNEEGGILDDLMATRIEDGLFLVVNAARKEADLAHLRARLGSTTTVELLEDRALLALQGPAAAAVLSRFVRRHRAARFHDRDGDGARRAANAWSPGRAIPARTGSRFRCRRMAPRRSPRCCLPSRKCSRSALAPAIRCASRQGCASMGMTSTRRRPRSRPASPGPIGKRRRAEGGFPGAALVLRQLAEGTARSRVGIRPDGRAPAREDTPIVGTDGKQHRAGDERRLRSLGRRTDRDGLCRSPPCRRRRDPRPSGARRPAAGPGRAPALCSGPVLPRLMPQEETADEHSSLH